MAHAFLLLGGNQDNPTTYFEKAIIGLEKESGTIVARSGLYKTAAWGMQNAPDFLNQAIVLETELAPEIVLQHLLSVENDLGRIRNNSAGYQNRTIDIDILLWDDLVVNTPELTIPHPRLHERRFALMPLVELIPETIHPVLHRSLQRLLADCSDPLPVTPVHAA